ncbi:MAG: V-type ATP synthase subunit I [Actinobacteria bacterium]|nr:V-type ATP synthase subunit I [Actinomycetota bacterium]
MAIVRMLQATVIGHISLLEDTVSALQEFGAVEIERFDVDLQGPERLLIDLGRSRSLDEQIARAQFVCEFLGRYHVSDVRLGAFISEKIHISTNEFTQLAADEEFDALYAECDAMSARLSGIERQRKRLLALVDELTPWREVRLQISQWKCRDRVALIAGTVPFERSSEIRQALREEVAEVTVDEAGRGGGREAWIVMVHKDVVDQTRSTLATFDFREASFLELVDYPAEEIARACEQLGELDRQEAELRRRALELESGYERACALVQALLSNRDALDIRENFVATHKTFSLKGWVPQCESDSLKQLLSSISSEVDITFSEPEKGQSVPVALKNPWYLRPFEVLTDLYGRPAYGGIDPTPLVAGFFFLFFGMCVGDAGYGAVLMALGYLIKTRLDVAPGVQRFMDLLIAGGLASIVVGVASRSYFALSVDQLPAFLRYQPLFDPLEDIMLLLLISVAIGVIHVVFGVLVNMYRLVKAGEWPVAVQDDFSGLLMIVALVLAGVTSQGLWLAWLGTAAVVLKGRVIEAVMRLSPKETLVGLGRGLLGLYGLSGYLSDFLSYTRLVALGLASLLVGQVMNILAGMVVELPWGIGILAAAVILIVGHAFNIAINILGAFVHSARLQFVEFFSKFYSAGGSVYSPFSWRTKSLVLHPELGEQEGGKRL